ncbi:Uncharacterized protein mitochondrial protein Mp05 [Gossypium arboreum]|uniref:Uncharacterized protein mitochondrial protein Mp05 n=1 Tax=Gossypium arboreum TaxID=29729 RepID=A0A0B0PG21_GOSAR|nr:Uncharacterized protein mitochondrial protein Mp05 [Gossypium arboreum]
MALCELPIKLALCELPINASLNVPILAIQSFSIWFFVNFPIRFFSFPIWFFVNFLIRFFVNFHIMALMSFLLYSPDKLPEMALCEHPAIWLESVLLDYVP